jgi:hypothetical protein
MTLEKSVTDKVFDSIDITIFKYLREYTQAFVCESLFWVITEATYDKVDDISRHAVCVETELTIRRLYASRFT